MGAETFSCMNAPHHVVNVFRKVIPEGMDRRRKTKEGKKRVEREINHGLDHRAPIHINSDDEFEKTVRNTMKASLSQSHHESGTSVGGSAAGSSGSGSVKDFFDVDLTYSKTRPQQTMEVCLNKQEYAARIGKC